MYAAMELIRWPEGVVKGHTPAVVESFMNK